MSQTEFLAFFAKKYLESQTIKYAFMLGMLSVMILGATSLVAKVAKAAFEASARQPEKEDSFTQKALVYIGFGDVFIGIAAIAVLPIIFKNPADDVKDLLHQAEVAYVQQSDQSKEKEEGNLDTVNKQS